MPRVSLTPCPTAWIGLNRIGWISHFARLGAIPMQPRPTGQPAGPLVLVLRTGVATIRMSAVPRRTSKSMGSPVCSTTSCCRSVKSSTARPLALRIRSPALKPAAAAGEAGLTSPTRGLIRTSPMTRARTAKMAMARMKLETGPAATTRARCQSGLKWK